VTALDPADRPAVLRRLAREDYAPGDAPVPWSAAAQAAAFAAAVGAFAAGFWDLPPAARRKQWADLKARTFGPAAAARLAELEPGLAVAPVPQPDAVAAAVAQLVKDLFVLPPAARAARRLAWLRADNRRDPGWAAAVRTVLRTDLPLARLEPRVFDWFSLNALPALIPADPTIPVDLIDHLPPPEYVRPAGAAEPSPPAAAAPGCGCGSWWLAVVVVVAIIRFLIATGDRRPAPAPQAVPVFPAETAVPGFTAQQVRQFQDYERALEVRKQRPATAPPYRYEQWVELGRPTEALGP
jgi:hypothetical protein